MFPVDTLFFFPDRTPRGGPAQMALDEALLEAADAPVLRTYLWSEPSVSFGYSQSRATVAAAYPALSLVRRWTGGGIVPHEGDFTFALIVPRESPLAQIRPAESYRQIHQSIAQVLGQSSVALAPDPAPAPEEACFQGRPAQYDLLATSGSKIGGGAQRRTRRGFLHQGSLQGLAMPPDFGHILARTLSASVKDFPPSESLDSRTAELVATKYATPAWTSRIP